MNAQDLSKGHAISEMIETDIYRLTQSLRQWCVLKLRLTTATASNDSGCSGLSPPSSLTPSFSLCLCRTLTAVYARCYLLILAWASPSSPPLLLPACAPLLNQPGRRARASITRTLGGHFPPAWPRLALALTRTSGVYCKQPLVAGNYQNDLASPSPAGR